MRWFARWYGANPLHLLTLVGCFALAWYAGAGLLHGKPVGVAVWFAGAVIGHDLILMPLYALADKSVMAVFRHRPPKLPTVPWINYLRVPVVLSGLLLLIWFPLIFKIPSHFPRTTDLSLDPYLGHWLAVTGALFLLSATALAVRLGVRAGRGGRTAPRHGEGIRRPSSARACRLSGRALVPRRAALSRRAVVSRRAALPARAALSRTAALSPRAALSRAAVPRIAVVPRAAGLPPRAALPPAAAVPRTAAVSRTAAARAG